ncbi:hypothetical protein ACIBQ6_22105 [Nonomuraea sp. NPDC049655]|uniref:hypothetical protein n=1 Tax=Nonomuraea sp. NPDC049655 TaxID=3364355 RepID=UPI00379E211D
MPDLREGRHSWNAADHPRDGDGQFARSAGGGSSHASDSPSGGRRRGRQGMPDTLASGSVVLSKGGAGTIERHANNDVSIGDGNSSKRLTPDQATKLLNTLSVADDWDAGETEHLPGVGTVTRTKGGVRADLDDGPSLELTQRDVTRLEREHERADQATRVDTGNGDVDVFPDGKKIGIRHLGNDGTPVEVAFNKTSLSKISSTIDQFIDDMDDAYTPAKDSYSKTVSTNVGKVRVDLSGRWGKPGSTLTISPEGGDDWGVAVDGAHQHDWSRAVSNLIDESATPTQHNLQESTSLTEAAGGQPPKGRRFRARIIQGDIQGSSGFYPAEMLKRDAAVFREGLPVFLDHPGATESYDRPERSVRDLAGKLASTAVYERDGLYADVEVYPHWAPVVEAMAGDIGMSIRASGTVEASKDEAIRGPIVTALTEAASVDFVTAAGAGGKVVALLESARAQSGDLLRKATEARPFSNGSSGGEILSWSERKTQVAEAANVGAWLESRIHSIFTQLADDMYGEGRLTREERITCSSAIGDALAAFTSRIEADAAHLYQRDPWREPEVAPAEVFETSKTKAPENVPAPPANTPEEDAPMSGGTNQQGAPDSGGALTEAEVTESAAASARAAVAEAERDQYRASAQALTEAQQAQARALAERDAAVAEARRLVANDAARRAVSRLVAESGLPGEIGVLITPRVESAVLDRVPLNESGQPNTQALDAAVTAAIEAERTYAARLLEAHGVGDVRGLGGSSDVETLSESDLNGALERVFSGIGLSADVAKAAAKGRVNI